MNLNNIPIPVVKSSYAKDYRKALHYHFGTFYIFQEFVVGEINEGVHFTWELAEQVINDVYQNFGTTDLKLAYISNRIYSYSVQPQDWINFFRNKHKLKCIGVVAYNNVGWISVVLEKFFSSAPFKKFTSLDDAVAWVTTYKEKTVA